MTTDKKAAALQWAQGAEGHRGDHQRKKAEAEARAKTDGAKRGGRPKPFGGAETVKVAVFLPEDLAAKLRAAAASQRKTLSEIVGDLVVNLA